ncbi:MAG: peptide ABC transporter substrate-binding protein [Gemmatimonadota bacterium]
MAVGASHLTRRRFLAAGGAGALGLFLGGAGCGRREGSQASGRAAAGPTGPAPAADQFYVTPWDSTGATYRALDFYETVYCCAPLADNFSIPLVRLDQNYQVVPGAATHWEQTSPLTWEFHLRPGILWSDGRELTAADFVETLRYSADPAHAWDFTWYWSGILRNYAEAVAGRASLDSIGVQQGRDPHTLVLTTERPVAFVPAACLYTGPLSAAALHQYGSGSYNINPATCVTCGPYRLHTYEPTAHIVLERNPKYTGPFRPQLDYQIGKIYSGGDMLPRFQTGEIDTFNPTALDLRLAARTPRMQSLHLYRNPLNFQVWYVFFETKAPPFDNLKVRQAFAHSVDRQPLIDALLAPLAIPAYGYLMPGYPFAVTDPLVPHTDYDPPKARQLLAEAGYPDGRGFPEIAFNWLPTPAANSESVVQALGENWNKVLFGGRPTVQLRELDNKTFRARMEHRPTQVQMGLISYGMDYFDASNMLGVYRSGGRHDWSNPRYDELLAEGAEESDPARRQEIYTEAQVLLTQEAPAVFIFHLLWGYYYWPYIQGSALDANALGYDGLQWPAGNSSLNTRCAALDLYVADNVDQYLRASARALL